MDNTGKIKLMNQPFYVFQYVTAVNQTCVRMAPNVLNMTVVLNASVLQDTKALIAMVSR